MLYGLHQYLYVIDKVMKLFKNKSILNTNLIYNLLNSNSNNNKRIQVLPAYSHNSNTIVPDFGTLTLRQHQLIEMYKTSRFMA